jgi:microcystin-dependent protein
MGGIGAWGGSESVVLELANIPQHSHWLEGPDGSANIWTDNTTGTGLSIGGSGHFEEVAADSFYTSSVGTGESFSVMPPYGTYLPIIKY